MAKLDSREAGERVKALPGWELQGESIRRTFVFGGFPDAVAFVGRLAFDAEAADHHPDVHINYKRVTLIYTTHSAGGLTGRDFDGAAAADGLARRMGAQ